jgi:hypothetical protein
MIFLAFPGAYHGVPYVLAGLYSSKMHGTPSTTCVNVLMKVTVASATRADIRTSLDKIHGARNYTTV